MQTELKKPALSKRQQRDLRRRIRAEQAAMPKPVPVAREEYVKPEVRHADDVVIPGLSGRGAIKRLDTLDKLLESGRITPVQYSAGRDYLRIVENYFASASGLARLSEEAAAVGGQADPIRRYIKARPAWKVDGKPVGYIPTQRPRNPSPVRSHSDGWTRAKLEAMSEFSRMARLVAGMERSHRIALCVLVMDPNRPDFPPLSIGSACRRLLGSDRGRNYAIMTRWLCHALDAIDAEIMAETRIAA